MMAIAIVPPNTLLVSGTIANTVAAAASTTGRGALHGGLK